ncbi:T9SS type A sorting domain-containing protein [Parapedobacter sp. 10938]|uniref:T9SS type A sorting domain-containing protein n=1 Tax=Parapedobacter flavus TaxID=3110225 RepID=UPI002DBCFF0C|nr:T9SS type A sorting domain-containing protein [Parapedobacter sp. 10938]MEC3881082.1 T9SS type A sorting domain-containing protein [Parapedobacter sp. 10938]
MRKFLHHIITVLTLSAMILVGSANAAQERAVAVDTSRVAKGAEAKVAEKDTELASPSTEKRSQRSFFSSFKSFFPFTSNNVAQDKLLSSVKVFPNPIVDQISLSYRLDKQSAVSIKVMDALGNEVMTLLSQELDAGPQSHVFETNNKLTNGFYFIRVSAGTETVVKRISVL